MKSSPPLRSKILLALMLTGIVAQSGVPLSDPRVRPIGELLKCQCGCPYTVGSCDMQNCHFAEPAREKILSLLNTGKNEQQILDVFTQEFGLKILTKPPAEGFFLWGWVTPWIGLGAGVALVWWFVRRLRDKRPAAAAPGTTPELDAYRDQIEKETDDF